MTIAQPDLLLDVSRTVSRIGAGGDSGVDRVERAYIRHLSGLDRRVFFVSRVLGGIAILDAAGMYRLLDLAADPARLPTPDIRGRLALRQGPARRRAETAVRRLAIGQARQGRAGALLARSLRPGFTYINTGHTHLEQPFLDAVRGGGGGRIAVMIHDVIPLDYPEYSRPGTDTKFAGLMKRVAGAADLVIYNSAETADRATRWFAGWGAVPESVTALLGVDPLPDAPQAPAAADGAPHFVVLGTIEPRKNHLLLLSVWRRFHDTLPPERIPHLHVIGRRGWENENILDILDRAPFMNRSVFEHGFLPDAEMAAKLRGARALLFPSFAEGFGYPLAEAVQLGVPAICSDLPVYREIAGDLPLYLDPTDGPGWARAILDRARAGRHAPRAAGAVPGWESHFDLVFSKL